ncbi:hypothetical protein [Bradyrhizobium diazoefficiens]|uniref:hypothetical protein n=1 Tax=Bradyrhizobium diazoefficiens TaxID=1355477 RepID=UPI003851724E
MDRQFLSEQRESRCGEISVIYRFSYSIREGKQQSRLPVTMNIVFPAEGSNLDCRTAAQRWLKAIEPDGRTPTQIAEDLIDPSSGPLAHLTRDTIHRLELNMQVYRKPASLDPSNFGTEATYLMRVFRWSKRLHLFKPTELPNQIDRSALLCEPSDSTAFCAIKDRNRRRLVAYLQQPNVVASLDNGTLDVPSRLGVLSRRGVSFSPGGSHRSANQPYWSSANPEQQVITDEEILAAIKRARQAGIHLSEIGSAEDFRTRLNDSACTGCHQTRAIAGFHFPGSDRVTTPPANAVLVAGSPHFYGDQPRRLEVVQAIAKSKNSKLPRKALVTSYSARPMARYEPALRNTQLVGGWGSTCIVPNAIQHTKRNWGCRGGFQCAQLFSSRNDPGLGTCIPADRVDVGDAMQRGVVTTLAFGHDLYRRTEPEPVTEDTRIPESALPRNPPPGNSYYASHQEFYEGDNPEQTAACRSTPPAPECYEFRRDRLTGGFPAGMLRLSECLGLPTEATCGLIASSGFNSCISEVGSNNNYDVSICFDYFTSFAGIRACDVATPCRDDYICVKPMNYTAQTYQERLKRLTTAPYFEEINGRKYDPNDYGQKQPDEAWVERGDKRGLCIPPYFVFQFRSDGHPSPSRPKTLLTYPFRARDDHSEDR